MPDLKDWNVMKPPPVPKPPPPKTHICSYCGRGFSRKEHLVSHLVKHTGKYQEYYYNYQSVPNIFFF